jgi:glycosyltransferase involved in cell wall biosynthesis
MRILLDARTVGREFSGVGNYVLELVRGFSQIDSDHEFLLLAPAETALRGLDLDGRFQLIEAPFSHESHPSGDAWEHFVLPRRARKLGVDLIHGPNYLVPLFPGKPVAVATIHDLIAFTHPQTIPRRYAAYMRWLIPKSLRRATRVITGSGAMRENLCAAFHIPAHRIDAIPHGVASRFSPETPTRVDEVLHKLNISQPYLLFVGNLEPRKNLPGLLRAFREVRNAHESNLRLVVAGKAAWLESEFVRALEDDDLAGSVLTTGFVDAKDLPALYSGAEAFVFPSFEEGFGLPVLEAMACGVPVVASAIPSIREIAGEAAVMIDPHEPGSIARGILRALNDPELHAALRSAGQVRAKKFSWKAAARATLDTYRKAMEAADR